MSAPNLSLMRRKILRWYEINYRDLPWRRARDPYAIWIAETMLQQTQVATVIPYYERFLSAFPTIHALGRAPSQKVLALWSGLGYYRRAENLKRAAQSVIRRYAGKLPNDYDALLSLPGVGDYTAGALMSIAFQRPYPAMDGNARRVLGRLFNLSSETELRDKAKQFVPKSRPGYFNQGLMELGATVCIPRNPRCPECPLASNCAMRRAKRFPESPGAKKRSVLRAVTWPLVIVRREGKILLRRRPTHGILAGLWEFPGGEVSKRESLRASLTKHLLTRNGGLKRARRIGELRHAITSRRIRAPLFLFDISPDTDIRLSGPCWRWLSPASLHRYPVSSMTTKALKVLGAHEKSSL